MPSWLFVHVCGCNKKTLNYFYIFNEIIRKRKYL